MWGGHVQPPDEMKRHQLHTAGVRRRCIRALALVGGERFFLRFPVFHQRCNGLSLERCHSSEKRSPPTKVSLSRIVKFSLSRLFHDKRRRALCCRCWLGRTGTHADTRTRKGRGSRFRPWDRRGSKERAHSQKPPTTDRTCLRRRAVIDGASTGADELLQLLLYLICRCGGT